SSSETLDQTFDRLQKLISQLEIQGPSSTSQNPQNVAFVSSNSTSRTNEADNTAFGVSTTHSQGNIVNFASVDNLSDVVICAFLTSQPNSPQLAREDLEQIDPDDLEEMDLHWEIAMLIIRAKRAPKNQENKGREYGRKIVPVEIPTKNDLIDQDGIGGYDWSYQSEEEHPTNYALMVLTSSESSSSSDSENRENIKSRSDKGYHAVPPPYIGNYIPPKPDLMFVDEQVESESVDVISNVASRDVKTVESKHESVDVKNKEFEPKVKVKTVRPSIEKIKFVKTAKKRVEKANIKCFQKRIFANHKALQQVFSIQENYFNKMVNTVRVKDNTAKEKPVGNPQQKGYKEKGVIDSGCSIHITGNKCYLTNYEYYNGRFVSFGDGKGRISRKGKIKTGTLDFNDVYFCKELKYNLFSVSQMCDKKNNVLFTNTECLVFASNFKLLDESQVLLRVSRKHNIYSVNLKSDVPTRGLTGLFAKATIDKSNLWHRRLRHISYETMNKLAEAVNTACYVLNKALVIKPHNKIPYELIHRRPPLIDFMKPFGCHVTILNTRDHLGKFDGKANEGFFCRVLCGKGPDWLFNIDSLTISINYVPVVTGKQTNIIARTKDNIIVGPKDSEVDAEKKATKVDESRVLDNGSTNAFEEHPFERFSPFKNAFSLPHVPIVTLINVTGIFGNAYNDEAVEEEVDMNNLFSSYIIPDATFTKFFKDHPKDQVIGSIETPVLTRQMTKIKEEHDKWAFGTKWVFRNKKDERGIVVKNKARLVTQGHTQEEGIDYDEGFAPVARIEDIRLFLAYAFFKEFIIYQMDVKSAFLYGKIEEELYVCQPPGFEDPDFPNKVYKIEKVSLWTRSGPKSMSDGIFISQDKYVADILKKFDFSTMNTASTPIEHNKALVKDAEAKDVDIHLYRLMIGLLMYLTASRSDITFAVCACARFQVTPKTSHLHVVKRIFRYLKG
nr:hypothetical protein [Tanacetum cinerariifolium]